MAATAFANMAFPTPFNQNQCIDPNDLDSFVDFGALPSPGESSGAKVSMSRAESTMTSPTNTALPLDYDEAPVQPSHEYGRYKQTTGLPTGSYANLTGISDVGSSNGFDFSGYNSGLGGELGEGSSSMFMGSNSGLGIDTDMNFDMGSSSALPAFFYPSGNSQNDDFVDPSAITAQEEQPKVRYYPGMHQQAAMAKAQAQAQQQRQQQMLQQQQQQQQQQQKTMPEQQPRSQGSRKSATPIDARTEETIARVVNQIRQNSSLASDASSPTNSASLAKMKKDEEDMDEDERLLNSEEGKKLSSKERRQLRNKVSARAFRSRRKEYIGQLEGDIASRANEVQDLKNANRALMEENARFRELTVKLLRHPAFAPFLEDISRDPALSDSLSKVNTSMSNTAAVTESQSQPMLDAPQQQDLQVGMTTIPETQLDFSALNLNGNWGMPNGFGYQPQIFAVTELPEGPAQPLEVAPKGEESIIERFSSVEEVKPEYPEFETLAVKPIEAVAEPVEIDESDPTLTLYADTTRSTSKSSSQEQSREPIFGNIAPEKALAHIHLTVTDGSDATALEARLAYLCTRAENPFQRLQAMSAEFE